MSTYVNVAWAGAHDFSMLSLRVFEEDLVPGSGPNLKRDVEDGEEVVVAEDVEEEGAMNL